MKSAKIDRRLNQRENVFSESNMSPVADETNISDDSEERISHAKSHNKLKLDRFNHLYLKGLEHKLKI